MFVAGDRGTEKRFGNAVALSEDVAVIGSYNDYHNENGSDSIHNAGSAYIFNKDQWGTGKWGQLKKLLADDREAEDLYGTSISLSDGYLTVDLPKDVDGEAYVYWEHKGGPDNWGNISVLSPEVSVSEGFGSSVAVSKGGIIVGGPSYGNGQGRVTLYENCQSTELFMDMDYRPELGPYLRMLWDEGKGDARVIFMKKGELDGISPADSTTYLADTVFGQGSQIDTSGWFCVYNNYYNQVQVTGLGPGTYQVKVLDYYGGPGTERYITGPAYHNPRSFNYGNDLSGITVNVAKQHLYGTYDTLLFSNTSTNGMDGGWGYCDEDSTWWDFHQGQVWVREDFYWWNSRFLLDIPERVEPPEYTINFLKGTTNENVPSTVEYLVSGGDWEDDAVIGPDTVIQLIPSECYEFRYMATDTTLASFPDWFCAPASPAAPAFTINYATETTVEKVTPLQEYAYNDSMGEAVTGTNQKAPVIPDVDMFFRLKSTATEFAGYWFHLDVPERSAAVSYAIDYANESTYQSIPSTDEYAYDSAMTSPVPGAGIPLSLTPGVKVYIRTKQTGSFFAGETFTLAVPVRPAAPIVSLSDLNSSLAIFKKSQDGTGANVTEADGYEYTTDNGNNWYNIFEGTTVDASGAKNIFVRIKATPTAFASKLSVNVDFELPWVSLKTDSACNGEANYVLASTNVDNGRMYIIISGVPQSTESQMITAVGQHKGAVVAIIDNYLDHQISTLNLNPGSYHAFAVNLTSEVKATSIDSVKINQNPSIDIGDDLRACPEKVTVLDPGAGFSMYEWSLADSTGQTLSVSAAGTYYVKVTNAFGCFDSDTMVLSHITPFEGEQICVVTIDTIRGNNQIIWEKTPDVGIAGYNLYREGTYMGTKLYHEQSIFEDTVANPTTRPFQYYLTALDSCGNESGLSPYHQPLFLQYNGSTGGVNLRWEKYVIQGDSIRFSDYNVYRGSDSLLLAPLATDIPITIYVYTDTTSNALENKYYYRVAGDLITPCAPSGEGKAGAGPYHHSLSNLDNNRQSSTGIRNMVTAGKLNIYPNPVTDRAVISFSNPENDTYQLLVYSLTGKVMKVMDDIRDDRIEFKREDLPNGLYMLELRGPKIYRGKMMIK